MTDWAKIRQNKLSKDRPDDWPDGIRAISDEGLRPLGIDEASGRLFWDGKEIVVRNKVRLGKLELWLIGIAAVGTFGTFVVDA